MCFPGQNVVLTITTFISFIFYLKKSVHHFPVFHFPRLLIWFFIFRLLKVSNYRLLFSLVLHFPVLHF